MRPSIIHKSPAGLPVAPNLADYQSERERFSWATARAELPRLPGGGLNIADCAVTRHARGPNRDQVAFRFLSEQTSHELT